MQAQNTTNPKPTRQDVQTAWAAYERAWQAAEADGDSEYAPVAQVMAQLATAMSRQKHS